MLRVCISVIIFSIIHDVAHAKALVWSFRNNFVDTVQIKFYSQTRSKVWPDKLHAWPIYVNQTQRYVLSCRVNEKICFGAWDPDLPKEINWGVFNNTKSCASCCHICGKSPESTTIID